jgi:hypothetical protein
LEAWQAIEPMVRLPARLQDNGYVGSQTPLLDAIELMDLHLRLEPDQGTPFEPAAERKEEAK